MLCIGSVRLETNLLLAPISGYCDLPFRLLVRGIRADPDGAVGLACTDLLCPQAVLTGSQKSQWLTLTCPQDRPLCMQLYGTNGDVMAEAARWAAAHGATTIDINMGCPVDKITKKKGGSMLLCNPTQAVQLARQIVKAVSIPVTAKIRLGWDCLRLITHSLPPALADVGIAAVTVHGRTTEQRFCGCTSLAGIATVVESLARWPNVPVIGNGDIKSPQDAQHMLKQTGCAGVMIGRGALGQPWIFRDTAYYLATGRLPPPLTRLDRAQLVLKHFELMMQLRNERYAVATIIRRMSWYSAALQPWPGLRRDIRSVSSAREFTDFMAVGMQRIAQQEDGGTLPHAA